MLCNNRSRRLDTIEELKKKNIELCEHYNVEQMTTEALEMHLKELEMKCRRVKEVLEIEYKIVVYEKENTMLKVELKER